MLTRIIADKAADAVNLKISKVGGLTKARMVRDLAASAGIAMNIEDTWYVWGSMLNVSLVVTIDSLGVEIL